MDVKKIDKRSLKECRYYHLGTLTAVVNNHHQIIPKSRNNLTTDFRPFSKKNLTASLKLPIAKNGNTIIHYLISEIRFSY